MTKAFPHKPRFFDFDHDGDLDCYVLNNSYRPIESFGYDKNMRNIRSESGGDKLYRNDKGKFTDVSSQAGIYGSEIGFGLGITVGDVNNDGWMICIYQMTFLKEIICISINRTARLRKK
jgi:hypothetical protein